MLRKRGEDKQVEHEVLWFSSPFLGLTDYLLHKATYWSTNTYKQRVQAKVHNTFMQYVEGIHVVILEMSLQV